MYTPIIPSFLLLSMYMLLHSFQLYCLIKQSPPPPICIYYSSLLVCLNKIMLLLCPYINDLEPDVGQKS